MARDISTFILVIFIIHAATISNWESHRIKIIDGDKKTYIKKLPYSMIWNAPTLNKEEALVQNWAFTISQIYLLALLYFSPVGITYLFVRKRMSDGLTTILSYMGLSLLFGALTVIIIYLIIGGWSPPGVIPIGTISIVIGIAIGVFKNKKFQRPTKLRQV